MIKLKDIITESPDGFIFNDVEYSWSALEHVYAVNLQYKIDGVTYFFSWLPEDNKILSDYQPWKDVLEIADLKSYNIDTHGGVKRAIRQILKLPYVLSDDQVSHSRIYRTVDDEYIISFWEKRHVLMPYRSDIVSMLKDIGLDPEYLWFEFIDNNGTFETYEQFILNKKENHKSSTSDKEIELLKLIHLNPEIKKAILKTPSNRWQKIADKLRMTPIELKRLIGRELAERSLNEDMTYKQLMSYVDDGRKERSGRVNTRSLPVSVEKDNESWNFRYKSSDSTTGKPFRGQIQFLKDVTNQDAQNIPVKVDCGCPDFKFRFAYNNTQQNASEIGGKSLNQCINRKPRPAYDYGVGMCKHLTALQEYLKTKIDKTKKSNLFEALDEVSKVRNFNVEYGG